MRIPLLVLMSGVVCLTVACGGDGDPPVATEVPVTAGDSSDAYVTYLQALVQTVDDIGEPLSVANIAMPPTSESDPPVDFD